MENEKHKIKAKQHREDIRAGKVPPKYTKKQFLEDLEKAKEEGPVDRVSFLLVGMDLGYYMYCTDLDELNDMLENLDEYMMFTDDSDRLMVVRAKFFDSSTVPLPKAYIVQQTVGRKPEEIDAVKERAVKVLQEMGYEVVDPPVIEENAYPMMYWIAKTLEIASRCRVVYFCKGWENDIECKVVHEAASACFMGIMYEE